MDRALLLADGNRESGDIRGGFQEMLVIAFVGLGGGWGSTCVGMEASGRQHGSGPLLRSPPPSISPSTPAHRQRDGFTLAHHRHLRLFTFFHVVVFKPRWVVHSFQVLVRQFHSLQNSSSVLL